MLAFPGKPRLFLYQEATDMRKGFEGLSAIFDMAFQGELTSGAYFVFVNRQRNIMKVLYWDADGLAIWQKRLEKGHFAKSRIGEEITSKLAYKPGIFYIKQIVRPKYALPQK